MNYNGMTDEELLEIYFSARDEQAFKELERRHHARLVGNALFRLQGRIPDAREVAVDLAQETWLHVLRFGWTPGPGKVVRGFLNMILINCVRDYFRRGGRRVSVEPNPDSQGIESRAVASGPGPAEQAEQNELLSRWYSSLPECTRAAVDLLQQGKAQKDIARELGVSEGTVSKWLTDARQSLQRLLAGGHGC